MNKLATLIIFTAIVMWACQSEKKMKASVTVGPYGTINDQEILQYTLQSQTGMVVKILNYGGTITDIILPDNKGEMGNVMLGFDSLAGYLQENNPYMGPLIGRYANRIGKATFKIGDQEYKLTVNNNENILHGGKIGFHKVIWDVKVVSDSSILLRHTSPDGEDGFPGNLVTEVTYTIGGDNSLRIDYNATSDKPTPVNFTNHAYFNLSAGKSTSIIEHQLTIPADSITPVDSVLIPTGKLLAVKETPFDFTSSKSIGKDIDQVSGGYDHNFVLNKKEKELSLAATLYDPQSGRKLELFTTEPGVQFYSGNFLDGSLIGKNGTAYQKHAGLCLEPQHFPDSPNQPLFPNTILKPGETYKQTSIFKFSIQ